MEAIQRVELLCNTWTDMHNWELAHSQIPARSMVVEEPEFIEVICQTQVPVVKAQTLWILGAIIWTKHIKSRNPFP